MTFGWALDCIKLGAKVARSGWVGKNKYVFMHLCDGPEDIADFLAIRLDDGTKMPWTVSHADVLAEDWHVV